MSDYLIVGGGLIGLFTARYLSEAGASVTLVERGRFGQESSWAGGGILSPLYPWKYPQPINILSAWSQARYPDIAAELLEYTGIDAEWTQSGLLVLDSDQTDDAVRWAQNTPANIKVVDAAEIHVIESEVDPGGEGGTWLPEVAQIRPPMLIQALKSDLEKRGVHMAENTEVTHLLAKRGRILGAKTEYSDLSADKVVIACGAWSATMLKELGQKIEIMPVRGQMLLYRGLPGQLKRIVLRNGHYAIPRRDGHVLVGSTMEEVGFDNAVTDVARDELVEASRELVPFLETTPLVRHWSGLRPGSPTGVPFIGAHPEMEGLFINAGHYRNGVVMAPASAHLMVDILLGRSKVVEPAPYALENRLSAA